MLKAFGNKMLFIDSNIWCYYFDKSSKEHTKVAQYLENIIKQETILINTVIIMEVTHFLIKNLGAKGKKKVESFLQLPLKIIDFNYEQSLASVRVLAEHSHTGLGGRDATILAAMKTAKVDEIVTNDVAFRKIKGIKVINPMTS